MLKEICKLTRLENLNLYGLNRLKYTTDKREKRRIYTLSVVWVSVILVILLYAGGYAYGLHYLGLTHAVPALFSSIVSLVLLFFGIFSASSNLFRKSGYDFLSALPVHPFSIVISRMIRMYIEDLLLSFTVTLPAICVYAYFSKPVFLFYPSWIMALLCMPLIPMSLSILFGSLISLLSSVFKKTALIQALITVAFVAFIVYASSYFTKMEDALTLEAIRSITEIVLASLEKTYLPAAWIGGIAIEKYAGLLPLASPLPITPIRKPSLTRRNSLQLRDKFTHQPPLPSHLSNTFTFRSPVMNYTLCNGNYIVVFMVMKKLGLKSSQVEVTQRPTKALLPSYLPWSFLPQRTPLLK